jgi:hypothetical protein
MLVPLSEQEGIMQSMRLMGVLIAATWMGFHSSTARADVTTWSTNAAACVPVSASGVFVTAGAVTAGAGDTVTLYCGITKSSLPGAFDTIEITYKGGGLGGVITGGVDTTAARLSILTGGVVTSELIEMPKATGAETVKCGIQSKGSPAIATERNLCENSNVDFDKNFYYVRIVLKSGIIAGQQETVYGSSLISTR